MKTQSCDNYKYVVNILRHMPEANQLSAQMSTDTALQQQIRYTPVHANIHALFSLYCCKQFGASKAINHYQTSHRNP